MSTGESRSTCGRVALYVRAIRGVGAGKAQLADTDSATRRHQERDSRAPRARLAGTAASWWRRAPREGRAPGLPANARPEERPRTPRGAAGKPSLCPRCEPLLGPPAAVTAVPHPADA
jgi:hypothetical protein